MKNVCLRRWLLHAGLLGLLGAALPTACWLLARGVVQDEPTVAFTADIDSSDIARVLALVKAHDPRRVLPGQLDAVVLGERDLDVLINHFAYRRLGAPTRVTLAPGVAALEASVHLPPNPFGRWLNVQARVVETPGMPQISALKVGGLPLPGWLGLPLLRRVAARAELTEELAMAADVVRRVNFRPQQLAMSYVLREGSAQRIVTALVPPAEQLRLRAYSDRLVTLAAEPATASGRSLARWIGPMFELARQRSLAGGDAVAENRAAILALTLYANGRSMDSWLPAARGWPRPQPQRLTLAGRDDSPLHLLISAALAVEGSSPLSKAVGLYKEVDDSRGGSGFSFNDLAADRAGTRLGEMAVQQPQRLQAAMARGVQEADFMPHAADLPEAMAEAEFRRRFGGIGEPRFVAMVAEIDRRVGALAALR
jgi:hypothetical protein